MTHNFKQTGRSILNGLGKLAVAAADSPKRDRIKQIGEEIERLNQERNYLLVSLIEPKSSEKPDEDFDLKAYERTAPASVTGDNNGRLTKCEGSWRDNDRFDSSHPGCPYRKTQHNAHEFTLRD